MCQGGGVPLAYTLPRNFTHFKPVKLTTNTFPLCISNLCLKGSLSNGQTCAKFERLRGVNMTKRELTELQQKFLDALFGEAEGDPKKAQKIAGYSENVALSQIVYSLRNEIQETASMLIAMNSPKAALALVGLLNDPNQSGAQNKIKVAESILNRTGVNAPKEEINLKVPSGGLFILPAKEVTDKEVETENDGTTESEDS